MGKLDDRKIGFIGLGLMGKPMARNLHAAGAQMTVTSRSSGPAEDLAGEGMTAVETAREVAAASNIVFIMVTDTSAVDKVLHGEDGVMAGLAPGKTVIDMSRAELKESQQELRLLEMLRHSLNLNRLNAAAIERTARARYTTG